MTPTQEAPVAQPDEQLPIASESEEPVAQDGQEPAAAAQTEESPEVKKLRDRLAEQGRKNAELNRLAQQQSHQLAGLQAQMGQITQYMTQQQADAMRARLNQLEPEQQIAFLADQVLNPRQPRPVVQPQALEQPAPDPRVLEAVDEINATYGLDDDPISPEDVGWHPTEAAWRKAATLMAAAKASERTTDVPTKPKNANSQPKVEPSTRDMIRQEIASQMGTGRPNSATPASGSKSGATIEGLNKMAADTSMSPRARAEKMRQLQTAG